MGVVLPRGVRVSGDTMTGPLVLPGNPTAALQAAPKQYVDTMLPLAGGTVSGSLDLGSTLSQARSITWSGGFPGTDNVGFYQSNTYVGTPTAGHPGPEGSTVALNFIGITETLAATNLAASALEVQHYYGGGSSDGGRNSVLIEGCLTGTIGASVPEFVSLQLFNTVSGNVVGSTSAAPLGAVWAFGSNQQLGSASKLHGATSAEFDFTAVTGATVDYMEFMKFVVFSPAGFHAAQSSAFLRFESADPNANDQLDYGLTFGDPQAASGGFPIYSTGTMLYSYTGSCAVGVDFSAVTFSDSFIKGPNGFRIENNNAVHTNLLIPPNGNELIAVASNDSPLFVAKSAPASQNYLQLTAASSGNPPELIAFGNIDTNVSLGLIPSGTGAAFAPKFAVGSASGPTLTSGNGVPTSTQPISSIYLRTDGATGSRLYVTSGAGAWSAVSGV